MRAALSWGVRRSALVIVVAALAACMNNEPGTADTDTDAVSGTPSTSATPTSGDPSSGSATTVGSTSDDESSEGSSSDDDASSSTTGEPVEVAEVHLVGRFDADARATWSGSTMRTRIDGTAIDLQLDGAGGVAYQIVVDGQPTATFVTAGGLQTYPIAADLAAGEHDIEVVRRNEGWFGAVQYVAFVPGADTTLVEHAWPYSHRIEFIGDSLTAGYGIECTSGDQGFSGETQSAWSTYAMESSRQVGAAPHLVAFSGKGVFQNYGGNLEEPMPVLYPRTITDDPASQWDFTSFVPDVVVINLGTNDFSAAIGMGDFVGAYVGLVQTVRGHYPSALIVSVTWANWGAEHEGWVQAALDQAGESDAITTSFVIDPEDGWGCDYHTNEISNQKLGTQLAELLQQELGW
jgi:hypothetical protein